VAHLPGAHISIEQVLEFVGSDATEYHTGQLKKAVLVPMEKDKLVEVDPTTRKKRFVYPDGTWLRFV
jgi:hypothetical protein